MKYRMEATYYEGMGGCLLLFMSLHHHASISYQMLTEIAKQRQGDYCCGWAEAVKRSKKGSLFSCVVFTEKIPTTCKVPPQRKMVILIYSSMHNSSKYGT